MNRIVAFFLLAIFVTSCKKDDGGGIPPREPLDEVQLKDEAALQAYLQTHFYNYEKFNAPVDSDFDYKIEFGVIEGVNADKIPLIDQVESKEVTVDSDKGKIIAKVYTLKVREGDLGRSSPTEVDSVYVNYQGILLNGTIFDTSAPGVPVWFDLVNTVRGFSVGAESFKPGILKSSEPDDGSFSVENYGIGAIFMPSILGYSYNFNNASTRNKIPVYSPLIFTMDLIAVNDDTDHDNDGVPSKNEDLDEDGLVGNDDTDEDSIPDYLDADDDGDGKPTRDEITDGNGEIITPYPDTDRDGNPDYLDSDS